jgi:(E)-4-hydroxy-3-methylbut-2-enyl-diphosphate synthase
MKRSAIKIKDLVIGSGNKIAIQSMTNTKTSNIDETIKQVHTLEAIGCDIVRISVPDKASAEALKVIVNSTTVPIVADIHFDSNLAIQAIYSGAHKIRINPSNFPALELERLVGITKEKQIPIRVGVNEGSIKGKASAFDLASYTLDNVSKLEKFGFTDIVISAKSSDCLKTIETYKILQKECYYPLHVGLTEAGVGRYAEVKSIYVISSLINLGIGDTIRVSLSGNPEREVFLAKDILSAAGKLEKPFEIISCPTCARTEIPVENIALQLEKLNIKFAQKIKISIMGCIVNGPGEAQTANIGICGGKGFSMLYIDGKPISKIPNEKILETIITQIKKYETRI